MVPLVSLLNSRVGISVHRAVESRENISRVMFTRFRREKSPVISVLMEL